MAAERYDAVDKTVGEAQRPRGWRYDDVLSEVAPVRWETASVKRT